MSDPDRPTTPHVTLTPPGADPSAAAGRSASLNTELGALSAMLPPVAGSGRPDILPGLQAALGPAFALERELGGGGMSRVFVANEVALGRRVAVKVLAPELMQGVSAERFAREVALAARLQDPHIVPVLTTGATAGGLPYYTMPFIDGESLRERMQRGAVGLEEAVRILRDVAEALEYAHGRGIVHRDIKPENVLLSGRNAVVADFGIAKAVSAARTTVPGGTLTSIGLSLGTPAYMAPEQAAGDAVDHRADLYSWGMMAWELLAGAHPFAPRALAAQLMAAQLTEMPRALDEARPGLPPMLGALVMACVAKSPDARPANAAAVLSALGGATTDLAITSGRRAPVAFPARKGRTIGVAAAVVLAVVAGGAWLATRGNGAAAGATAAGTAPSLAVLPFEHQGDSTDAYLTDGITDEVRNKLTGVSNLAVIARASSNQYRGKDKSPQAIAKELGVRWLLTGTVRVMGSGDQRRVVVRPELVEVMPDGRLQSRGGKPFDGPLTDVVRAQSEVAEQVVGSMEVAVGGDDRARLAALPTRDAKAYDLYLRAMAATNFGASADASALRRASELLEQAVARDSTLVDAWSALARTSSLLYFNVAPTPESARRARAAVERARALAPGSAAALRASGSYLRSVENDIRGSHDELERARAAAPGDAAVLSLLSVAKRDLGQPDEALRIAEQAGRLDPRSALVHLRRGEILLALGRLADAREAVARGRALAPTSFNGIRWQVMVELAAGDLPAAQRVIAEAGRDVPQAQLLADLGSYFDLAWVLTDADQRTLLALDLAAFVDDPVQRHVVRAQVLRWRGDSARARASADSALPLLRAQEREAPRDPQVPVLQALMLAHAGRVAESRTALARALALTDEREGNRKSAAGAYFHYVGARAALLAGDRTGALALLAESRRRRYFATPAWIRLDPSFAALRGDPAFERMLGETP